MEYNVFVKNRAEVNEFYENPYVDVIFACYLTEKIVQLTLRSKKEHVKPSRQSHIVNGNSTAPGEGGEIIKVDGREHFENNPTDFPFRGVNYCFW